MNPGPRRQSLVKREEAGEGEEKYFRNVVLNLFLLPKGQVKRLFPENPILLNSL
jgi:hypothetical protein